MEVSGTLSGAAPFVQSYQIDASVSRVGQAHRATASNGAGQIRLCTTTSSLNFAGVNLDTATYTTTQGTGTDSAERKIRLVVNPDAIIRARLSGGATEGTALTARTVTTASTAGTVITTGFDYSGTTVDEGSIWGYSGSNAGQLRKITSVSTVAATVTVPFDYDTVVGDQFLHAPYNPFQSTTIQLTTNVQEADATIAVATGAQFRVIGLEARDISEDGTRTSYVVFVPASHYLNRGASDT